MPEPDKFDNPLNIAPGTSLEKLRAMYLSAEKLDRSTSDELSANLVCTSILSGVQKGEIHPLSGLQAGRLLMTLPDMMLFISSTSVGNEREALFMANTVAFSATSILEMRERYPALHILPDLETMSKTIALVEERARSNPLISSSRLMTSPGDFIRRTLQDIQESNARSTTSTSQVNSDTEKRVTEHIIRSYVNYYYGKQLVAAICRDYLLRSIEGAEEFFHPLSSDQTLEVIKELEAASLARSFHPLDTLNEDTEGFRLKTLEFCAKLREKAWTGYFDPDFDNPEEWDYSVLTGAKIPPCPSQIDPEFFPKIYRYINFLEEEIRRRKKE